MKVMTDDSTAVDEINQNIQESNMVFAEKELEKQEFEQQEKKDEEKQIAEGKIYFTSLL